MRRTYIATHDAEVDMLRFLMILTLISVPLFSFSVAAYAEMPHLDLGTGATDYLSKMAMPLPANDMPSSVLNGRMAISAATVFSQQATQHTELLAEATRNFWVYMAVLSVAFLGGAYLLGLGVIKGGWKVGYTRKAQALILYFLPYLAMQGPSPYSPIVTASVSLGVFVLLLMLLSAPLRSRVPAMATAFASIDRPEDRPFTLTWLITSVVAAWGVIVLWLWLAPETAGYLFVALFISGVGDALAEPVGLYFGKRSYKTRALGTNRTYIRTYEGSATVFLSGVIAVLIVHSFAIDARTLTALALFPLVGMIAEAKSPHTWDQPFIIGSCALVAVGLPVI